MAAKRGPTREQLTDKQWQSVCRVFDIIYRAKQRQDREKAGAAA